MALFCGKNTPLSYCKCVLIVKSMIVSNVFYDFQCRADVPDDFNEMSGPRVAEAYRHDKLHGRWRVFQWNKKDEQSSS